MIKLFIYSFVKIFFFITPLAIFLKKRFISQNKKRIIIYPKKLKKNFFLNIIDNIFFKEYILRIKNQNELRDLLALVPSSEVGRRWAEIYFNQNDTKNLEDLKKTKIGTLSLYEGIPLFKNLIKFIKDNKFENNSDVHIIQLGSSSGKDLEFFYNHFPKLNYISTDISDEILDFQKEKYKHKNFNFFKCFAEDIDKCINHFNIKTKNIIIFSHGSLQYVMPCFLKDFFLKVSEINNVHVFINEPFDLKLLDKKDILSIDSGALKFTHDYEKYAKNLKILEKRIIKLYPDNDLTRSNTANYYLQLSNK